uniref:FtsX-like permease family protein n=1 Tax=candidate division WWE3 bacterium TaxID=2053526 RepID=A0A7C4XH47_UNCKA
MLIAEIFNTSIKALNANKIRSFLTILGIIIGVFAVVTLISLGKGVQNYISDQFDALGSNLLFVSPGTAAFGNDPAEAFTINRLERKHIELLERNLGSEIDSTSAYYVASEYAKYKTKTYLADVTGLSATGGKMFNYEMVEGRYFTKAEENNDTKVVVLGPNVSKELFSSQTAVGQRIDVSGDNYEVIGVFKSKGSNFDDQIIIPFTAMEKTFGLSNLSSIVVKAKQDSDIDFLIRQVELVMLQDLKSDEFNVLSQSDILGSIQSILGMLTIALSAIAGISLLVGGIGIMNIMLVSVTERIREIGLRKAVGASPFNIGLQFLTESVLLSVLGGLIGLVLGMLATAGAQQFIRAEITGSAVLLSFIFSVVVGVIFGTYPAVNAAKKDPIEALRHE